MPVVIVTYKCGTGIRYINKINDKGRGKEAIYRPQNVEPEKT